MNTEREKLEASLQEIKCEMGNGIEYICFDEAVDFIDAEYVSKKEHEEYKLWVIKQIETIKTHNPYPESVFIEPTKEQYQQIHEALTKLGMSSDKLHGAMGRRLWESICNKLIQELEKKNI